MSDRYAAPRGEWSSPRRSDDRADPRTDARSTEDGWGQSRSVRGGTARAGAERVGRALNPPPRGTSSRDSTARTAAQPNGSAARPNGSAARPNSSSGRPSGATARGGDAARTDGRASRAGRTAAVAGPAGLPSPSVPSRAARPGTSPDAARSRAHDDVAERPGASARARDDGWSSGPASRDKQRANRLMERQLAELNKARTADERGVRAWVALAVLIAIAALGGLIDTIGSIEVRGGFNVGIVVASIVAILIVKRSHMFPVVIAPPIVYSLGAVFQLYLRSSGLSDKKVVLDAAANYLVYGFPAIAAASAAVLIVAGVRLIVRR